jgi:hypothetical protein
MDKGSLTERATEMQPQASSASKGLEARLTNQGDFHRWRRRPGGRLQGQCFNY